MPPKIEIIGDVNKIAQYISWAKKQWAIREGIWYRDLKDCLIEFKNFNDSGYIRFFVKTVSGFAFHPRSTSYPNGINTDTETAIVVPYPMFPLYDDDKGTMVLEDSDGSQVGVPDRDNYGVHAWSSEDETVSWRGWPSITLGLDREVAVEGVTQLDVQTAYNTYYTPLSSYIYSGGEKIATPGKVRGAGISDLGFVIVTTVNYTQYDIAGFADNSVNPEGGVGGYYDELYVQAGSGVYVVNGVSQSPFVGITTQTGESLDGWLRIGHTISTVSNLGVWFSADAKTAECDEGTWSWSYSAISQVDGQFPEIALPNGTRARPQGVFSSTFTARPIDDNKYQVIPGRSLSSNLGDPDQQQSTASMWTKTGNLSWNLGYMQYAHAVCYMKYLMGGSRYIAVDNLNSDQIPLKYQTRPDPTNYYIDVFFSGIVGQPIRFTPMNFKSGPYTWSGEVDVAEDTASATISYTYYAANCGTKTITVTDACGFSSSVEVRMKTGYWCAITQTGYECQDGIGGGCNHTSIPCNGCCGMVRGYWAGTIPDSNDITATSYNEYKYLEGVWCFLRPGDIVCTLTRKWVCSVAVCSSLPPVTC